MWVAEVLVVLGQPVQGMTTCEWRVVRASHTQEIYRYETEEEALRMLRTNFPDQLRCGEARAREEGT